MHTLLKSSLAAASALALAGPAIAQADFTGRPLTASLTGAVEIPPGDEDGSGMFEARINPGRGELCYTLTVSDIAPATLAHIHVGEAGSTGGPVVDLTAPSGGSSSACVAIDRQLAQNLIRNPGGYYVNVHNADFPGGAVRGQLAR